MSIFLRGSTATKVGRLGEGFVGLPGPAGGGGRPAGCFEHLVIALGPMLTFAVLSVMVTGPLRKQAFSKEALLGRVSIEFYRGSLKLGIRPAFGRREDRF